MELAHHRIGRVRTMWDMIARLVPIGIELLPHRRHRADSIGLQEVHQRGEHQLDACNNRLTVGLSLGRLDRTLEVVDNRQQVAQEVLLLTLDGVLALAGLYAASGVFVLGQGAQVFVL